MTTKIRPADRGPGTDAGSDRLSQPMDCTNSAEERNHHLVEGIDAALAQAPALTEQQMMDVKTLRQDVQRFAAAGRLDKAQDCAKRAVAVIREGAPVPE